MSRISMGIGMGVNGSRPGRELGTRNLQVNVSMEDTGDDRINVTVEVSVGTNLTAIALALNTSNSK
jgi:hypothetical protein